MLNFMFLGTNGSMQGDEGNTSLLFKGSRGTVLVDASCGLAGPLRQTWTRWF